MAELSYVRDGYVPFEGDVVVVPRDRLGQLVNYNRSSCYVSVDRGGRPARSPGLTPLDRRNIPRPLDICRQPLKLVSDGEATSTGVYFNVPWQWTSSHDLIVGLPAWAVVVDLDEPREEHEAKAKDRRVTAAVACAFAEVVIGEDSWRLSDSSFRTRCLQEAEVFLDRVREETDSYPTFQCIGQDARLLRGWPRRSSYLTGVMRHIVTCASRGGKARNARKGLNKDSWHTPTQIAVPSWDIGPLLEVVRPASR